MEAFSDLIPSPQPSFHPSTPLLDPEPKRMCVQAHERLSEAEHAMKAMKEQIEKLLARSQALDDQVAWRKQLLAWRKQLLAWRKQLQVVSRRWCQCLCSCFIQQCPTQTIVSACAAGCDRRSYHTRYAHMHKGIHPLALVPFLVSLLVVCRASWRQEKRNTE